MWKAIKWSLRFQKKINKRRRVKQASTISDFGSKKIVKNQTSISKNYIKKIKNYPKGVVKKKLTQFDPREIFEQKKRNFNDKFFLDKFREILLQQAEFNKIEVKQKAVASSFIKKISWVPSIKSYRNNFWGENKVKWGEGFSQNVKSFQPNKQLLEGFLLVEFLDKKNRRNEIFSKVKFSNFQFFLSSTSKGKFFLKFFEDKKPMRTGRASNSLFNKFKKQYFEFVKKTEDLAFK